MPPRTLDPRFGPMGGGAGGASAAFSFCGEGERSVRPYRLVPTGCRGWFRRQDYAPREHSRCGGRRRHAERPCKWRRGTSGNVSETFRTSQHSLGSIAPDGELHTGGERSLHSRRVSAVWCGGGGRSARARKRYGLLKCSQNFVCAFVSDSGRCGGLTLGGEG